jgi:7,8-dihydropterin-6-yl-methyl-4-(beta-D-ribofuranosyl)aminobenzene 5'-phosphate synthase
MNRTRRTFLLATAAGAAQCALPRLAWSSTRLESVPSVDSLAVTVITDSSYDTPRIESNKWVKVKRSGFYSKSDFRRALHNEWGLALALESTRGGDTRRFMLDYGYTPAALMNNMEIVGVDPSKLDALILSHGHYDHFGGLVDFVRANRQKLPRELMLYVGGEENFCQRKSQSGAPGHFSDWGTLDRRELEALDVRVVYCEKPTVVRGQAFTTGSIPRRSFEKVFPNTSVVYGKKDGLGCDMPELAAKTEGKPVPDEHWNEHATCFNVAGRGLVVISSCGHSGIVNTVLQARDVSGIEKVHAVLGGFHLFPADDPYLRQVASELRSLDPDVVIPLHCSGPGVVRVMREMMPDKLVTSTTGTEFRFGA